MGRKRNYPWGNEFDRNKCNTRESGVGDTTPVGHYSPTGDSPCGAADLVGNVWEWTSSLKRDYPYRADDGREDRGSSARRVLRGGSFFSNGDYARAASCYYDDPNYRNWDYGFRVGAGGLLSLSLWPLETLASDPLGGCPLGGIPIK